MTVSAAEPAAQEALADALAAVREPWEPEITARNLRLIREAREAREKRGEAVAWIVNLESSLGSATK